MDLEPFFMVYGSGQSAPTIRHESFDSAKRESERLARNNPGVTFFVLATVGRAKKTDVEFASIDPTGIPF